MFLEFNIYYILKSHFLMEFYTTIPVLSIVDYGKWQKAINLPYHFENSVAGNY